MSAKKKSADASMLKAAPHPFIASALRSLETEREGLTALAAAIGDGLGASFVAAVETIRDVRGSLIVTGMGNPATSREKSPRRSPRPAHRPFSSMPPTPVTATSA